MALKPELSALIIAGTPDAPHTLDVFLDYVCPFSKKMLLTIDRVLKPLLDDGGIYFGKVKVIFRPQVQPWHATSTFTHEAGIAAAMASPATFYQFAKALFTVQDEFFDLPSLNQTPLQIRERLAGIATKVIPAVQLQDFVDLLVSDTVQNTGVGVTNNLKYTIKFARQNSIHVSPTVLWDGLVQNQISSSWGANEWNAFLLENVTV
ncbi:hypothetical protein JOM56_008904 [Amanita muscaria]